MQVFVGLSGGVDSATAAALLLRDGHDVTGVFIRIWRPEFLECTWREDRLDAMRVAAALGIPFKEVDLSEQYEREVVRTMVQDYQAGITPNPDILCNEKIKFGAFLSWALQEGAEMVATGHYARVTQTDSINSLHRGVDPTKDQSYFLYRLGQDELSHVLLPIGSYHKKEIRALAAELRLPVAQKPDSQGLCFVGDISMAEFLKRYIDVLPGNVVDTTGTHIGTHDGAALYTVGQRHGFTIGGTAGSTPHYITHIDTQANTLTVSVQQHDAAVAAIALRDIHWINGVPHNGTPLTAQPRYHAQPVDVQLSHSTAETRVMFKTPQIVSQGQAVVIYTGDDCLGGGVACA